MKITIVTVCLNCENVIQKTIQSVLSQEFKDYEYLIIDGNSKDNTVKLAKKMTEKYSNVRVFSESDNGTYDAMNKAVQLAKGNYIFFLNAGDYFLDEKVLLHVSQYLNTDCDIYYGKVNRGGKIEEYPSKLTWGYLVLREKMVCHQAIFAKKTVLSEYPFDLSLKICADRDWLIHALISKKTMYYMSDVIVTYYDCNGQSSIYEKFQKESIQLSKKYGGFLSVIVVRIKRVLGRFKK